MTTTGVAVHDDFKTFCSNLYVDAQKRADISSRYRTLTQRLNRDFYSSDSESAHSKYVGSYGRGTATRRLSDLDMLFQLPNGIYSQYHDYLGNGQSALLQAVRTSIRKKYPLSEIGADGQVVVISFTDGITFEILPAFLCTDGKGFLHPDSNNGGSWKFTNPLPEIAAINVANNTHNKNLKRLCRMTRAWADEWNVPISGLLIDTLAYNFLRTWPQAGQPYTYYDWMTRDFFGYLAQQPASQTYWCAPGSGAWVYRTGAFEHKAKKAYNLAVEATEAYANKNTYTARKKWREIFGSRFPA